MRIWKKKSRYDDLIIWLSPFANPPKRDPSLPDMVELNDAELARQVFALEEMFEWRYLPSQLLNEDERLMDDLTTMRWLVGKMGSED